MLRTIVTAAVLCVIEFFVIVGSSPRAKPSIVLRFLPADVREAAKDHPEPPKHRQMIAHLLLAFFLISMLCGVFYTGMKGVRDGCGFIKLTLRFIVLLYTMKLFDIAVQDQWLVLTYGYYKKIYPETTDCEGWKDRNFNRKNQMARIIVYPFLSMLMACLFLLFGK